MNEETVQLVEKYTDQIGNFISALAEQLGVASEFVYEILVRQQFVMGLSGVIMFLISGLLIFSSWKLLIKYKNGIEDDFVFGWGFLNSVLTFGYLIGIMFQLPETLAKLINPHYYAIQETFEFISNITN